jgi:ribosomal protein S18 acetylase RimI-like enzyme
LENGIVTKIKMAATPASLGAATGDVEPFDTADIDTAAALMVASYRGTVDWEDGDDESVAAAEIHNTISGEYGTFLPQASLQARVDGVVVSQIICTLFQGVPLVVFVYTHPAHTGRGLATSLIRAAAEALAKVNYTDLTLYVTDSNPAVALYEKLGFHRA